MCGNNPGPKFISTGLASGDKVVKKGLELFTNQLKNSTLLIKLIGRKKINENIKFQNFGIIHRYII